MRKFAGLLVLLILSFQACTGPKDSGISETFKFEMNFNYPGDPEFIYDHLTGDISAWWDHSFSQRPYKLYIEARPGGGFYEIFDESGDGAKHATVIFARRGEMLRMEGPLGLSGQALTMVCTYTLKAMGEDGTLLTLNVNGAGEISKETPELVRQVWEHFLWEQFHPYIQEVYRNRD
jgi:hypothetical protein